MQSVYKVNHTPMNQVYINIPNTSPSIIEIVSHNRILLLFFITHPPFRKQLTVDLLSNGVNTMGLSLAVLDALGVMTKSSIQSMYREHERSPVKVRTLSMPQGFIESSLCYDPAAQIATHSN